MADINGGLSQKEQDIQLMLAAQCHLGTKNCQHTMERYVYRRREDGIYIFNLEKTWEKLQLAARTIVAIENPQDIMVQSARPYGQRAVFKFAQYVGCKYSAGRHTPGTFTNQIQKAYEEPRLLIVTDPRTDHQPVKEASYTNIPTIALCDTDSPLHYIDVAIPCNNKSKYAIATMYWLLARTVLQMRGTVNAQNPFEPMVDLFFYREPEVAAEGAEGEETAGYTAAPGFGAADDAFGAGGFGSALPGEGATGFDAPLGYGGDASGFEAAAGFEAAVPAGHSNAYAAYGQADGAGFGTGFAAAPADATAGFAAAPATAAPAAAGGDWE